MLTFQTVATIKPAPDAQAQGGGAAAAAPAAPSVPAPRATRPDALSVVDLSKSFRSGFLKRHTRGIEGVSFTVPQGAVFALLGHNGAGKTTTINCILDLVHPDGGEVRIMGEDHRRCHSRARVGYLPERPYFFEHLTGRELLAFYADLLGLEPALQRARSAEVLDRTGMTAHADRRLRKYSKGMLQRIGLAQTLLGDPDLLILDEPMSGLDPMGRREIRELLLQLKAQGKTIILSSHIVPDVEMIADSVGIIRDGRLVETRSLLEFSTGCSYQVNLTCPPAQQDGLQLPAWARARLVPAGTDRLAVATDNIDQLRELLAVCHDRAVPVQSVDTRRTGLEEIFMSVHAAGAAEVVQ